MARQLEVGLFGDRVGTLSLVDGRLSFQYRYDCLLSTGAVSLGSSLQL